MDREGRIRTWKKFPAVGEACIAVFRPTPNFKGRTFVSSRFSTEGTLTASAVPHGGWTDGNRNAKRIYSELLSGLAVGLIGVYSIPCSTAESVNKTNTFCGPVLWDTKPWNATSLNPVPDGHATGDTELINDPQRIQASSITRTLKTPWQARERADYLTPCNNGKSEL